MVLLRLRVARIRTSNASRVLHTTHHSRTHNRRNNRGGLDEHKCRNRTETPFSKNDTMAILQNSTSQIAYEWEYYYDYLDPVIVDESKLEYNKYSIVIILWVTLVAFVGFLFLSLNLMSLSGNFPKRHKSKNKSYQRTSTA